MAQEVFTRNQAITIGLREVCRREGHRFNLPDMTFHCGGVQGENAACDDIKCDRCDVKFTATYAKVR